MHFPPSFAPWIAVALIALLSLVPGNLRPHTGLPGQAEHFIAYFVIGFVLAARFRTRTAWLVVIVSLGAYAAGLEILQRWIPDRNAQFIDFAASFFGALCGVGLFIAILQWRRRNDALTESEKPGPLQG